MRPPTWARQLWARGSRFACTSNRLAVGGRLVDIRTPGAAYGEPSSPCTAAIRGTTRRARSRRWRHSSAILSMRTSSPRGSRGRVRCARGVGRHPLVLVDGAHNAAGMMVLARALTENLATDGRSVAVVGMLTGRDPSAMLEALLSAGVRPSLPAPPDSPRALPAADVAEAAFALGMEVAVAGDPARQCGWPSSAPLPRTSSSWRLALCRGRRQGCPPGFLTRPA